MADDVRERLTGTAEDYIRLGEGIIGIRNPDTVVAADVGISFAEWASVREPDYYRSAFPNLFAARLLGGDRLSVRVVEMLEDYIRHKWIPAATTRLSECKQRLKAELEALGQVPDTSSVARLSFISAVQTHIADSFRTRHFARDSTMLEKSISVTAVQHFKPDDFTIPSGLSLITQRKLLATHKARLLQAIPAYITDVIHAIVRGVKRLIINDKSLPYRTSRFPNLATTICSHIQSHLTSNKPVLEQQLHHLIQPHHPLQEVYSRFSTRPLTFPFVSSPDVRLDVISVTIDVLALGLCDLIKGAVCGGNVLEEDEEMRVQRGRLNGALECMERVREIVQNMSSASADTNGR